MTKAARSFALFLAMAALLAPAAAQAQFNAFKDPVVGGASGATASGPELKAANDSVTGGKVTVGATTSVMALFKNTGTAPVTVTGINLYPSSTVSSQITLNKCAEAPLPPEAQCAITVAVTGLQVGAWRVEVLVDHDGRSRLATAAMTGDVDGTLNKDDNQITDEIEAIPSDLDFGSANGGVPLVRSVLLRNRTSDNIALTSFKLDVPPQGGFVSNSECPESLAPSGSCVVTIVWTPQQRGLSQGILLVGHSGKSSLTRVDIKGIFEPGASSKAALYPDTLPDTGTLITDKESVDFGAGIKSASSITVSLINSGSRDLALKSIGLAGSDNGLSLSRSGCRAGLVLKPVDACALTISWVPSREGSVIDDLQILHTGARGVLILPIRGSAAAAASRDSAVVRTVPPDVPDILSAISREAGAAPSASAPAAAAEPAPLPTPSLDGYSITSLSNRKAIINGPIGSLVVRDGEDVVIGGVKWTVTVGATGVTLSNRSDEVMLVFDRSLRAGGVSIAPAPSSSNSSSASPSSSSGGGSTSNEDK